ncbi:biosynthetic-type acetolactate synthase large subunit [Magnetospira thiophila]
MKGAEYIAQFLVDRGIDDIYLLTGGAATFLVDALARNPGVTYKCFQHEQGAAMAGDAVWRVSGKVGGVMATSGPGATNLVTGICCNWFDSIPCLYVTGQVNLKHAEVFEGTKVRQFGFQEADIVEMVKPVTKYARQVTTAEELKQALIEAYNAAITGRMGPALIDVPMDLQQAEVGDEILYTPPVIESTPPAVIEQGVSDLSALLAKAERPVILFGAGIGLAGAESDVQAWLEKTQLPTVASWSGSCYLQQDLKSYLGCIGVYGNRGANYVLQNCDTLIVIGSRLDTRQRPGDPLAFAPAAQVHVIDLDVEELKKYDKVGYGTTQMHLKDIGQLLNKLPLPSPSPEWVRYVKEMKERFYGKDIGKSHIRYKSLSPIGVIQKLNALMRPDAIVAVDCGATTCWFFQGFHRTSQTIFTNGGCAPISYGLSAAIGAAFEHPERQVINIIGDGGFQSNVQELQTIAHYGLNVKVVILNNYGYGIVKQFQDLYMESRYEATAPEGGYTLPDLEVLTRGFRLAYHRIDRIEDLTREILEAPGGAVIDVTLHPNTLIEPKLELGRPINDQYPYVSDEDFTAANRFVPFDRPEWVSKKAREPISD